MRKEKGGKRGRKKMDEREKESEVEERVEVTEEVIERREEEEIEERPAIEEAVKKKRGVKIQSAILQPREPGCVQLLLIVRKFPLWNL